MNAQQTRKSGWCQKRPRHRCMYIYRICTLRPEPHRWKTTTTAAPTESLALGGGEKKRVNNTALHETRNTKIRLYVRMYVCIHACIHVYRRSLGTHETKRGVRKSDNAHLGGVEPHVRVSVGEEDDGRLAVRGRVLHVARLCALVSAVDARTHTRRCGLVRLVSDQLQVQRRCLPPRRVLPTGAQRESVGAAASASAARSGET